MVNDYLVECTSKTFGNVIYCKRFFFIMICNNFLIFYIMSIMATWLSGNFIPFIQYLIVS